MKSVHRTRQRMKTLWLFAALCGCVVAENNKLIVLMIDGFRWDYFDFPGLKLKAYPKFVSNGVKPQYINPVYPSLSYPNINSFVTGLYPENHGFVENYLWDKKTNEFFQMIPEENTTDPMWWNDAEPIWITAEKNKKHSAVYFWAGCEVARHDHHPMICERHRYDPPSKAGKNDAFERIDDILEMFQPSPVLERERLDLGMMYLSWVDWAGHYRGVDTMEMKNAIMDIDDVLDYLLTSLKKKKLQNKVNIIMLADHGMQDVSNSSFITLDKYAANIKYQVNTGPTSTLVPMDGKEEKLFSDIKSDNIKGLHIYRVKDIPEKFHTKNAHRIGPIVLEADPYYFIKALQEPTKRKADTYYQYYGEHGYNPENNMDMKSIFMAMGPDFRSNFKPQPFDIIDIYNLMCHLLKIEPLPNNGTWDHVEPMLRTAMDGPFQSSASYLLASFISVGVVLLSLLHSNYLS